MAPLSFVTHDPSAPYDGAPPQRSWEENEKAEDGCVGPRMKSTPAAAQRLACIAPVIGMKYTPTSLREETLPSSSLVKT